MRKLLAILVLALVSLAAAQVTEVNCWDYYKFDADGYEIKNLISDDDNVAAGDMISFSGTFNSNVDMALPEVRILVQVWYFDEGMEALVDEFFVDVGLIDPMGSREFKGAYLVPENAKAGRYLFEAYALQKNFPLVGTPFLRGTPGARMQFTIESDSEDFIFFDPTTIFYDETQVGLHTSISTRIFAEDEDVVFKAVLVNPGAGSRQVTLKKELYYWDAMESSKIQALPDETFQMTETQEVDLNLGKMGPGTYILKLTAESGGSKAVLKLRFSVYGFKPRIWYSGLLGYPLENGESNSVILCIGNMAPDVDPFFTTVSGTEEDPLLEDEEYDPSYTNTYSTKLMIGSQSEDAELSIPSNDIQGFKIDFTSNQDSTDFRLVTELDEPDFNTESLRYKPIKEGTETIGKIPRDKPDVDKPKVPVTPKCGDGICSKGETCSSCSQDCGECPPPPEEPAADMTPLILLLLVVIVVIVFVMMRRIKR